MELIELEAFIAIAQTGGFTRAAESLRLSQPAISRRIELLEREVGTLLFERVPGGVRLTGAGEVFLPHAQRALAAVGDAAAAVRDLESGERGPVTLALVGTLASTGLTARLRVYREAHPEVRLALRTARSDEVSALVRRGEVELGLRYFTDPDRAVVSRLVEVEALVVVCAGHSRLVGPDVTEAQKLAGVSWVGFPVGAGSSGEPFARVLERQLLRTGLDGAEIVAVDSLTAQKRLIEADFGLGLLPASSVEEELRLGTLRLLAIAALETTVPGVVIYRREGYLSAAARRLLVSLSAGEAD